MEPHSLKGKIEEIEAIIGGLQCTLEENKLTPEQEAIFLKIFHDYSKRLDKLRATARDIQGYMNNIDRLKYISSHALSCGLSDTSLGNIKRFYIDKIQTLCQKSEEY